MRAQVPKFTCGETEKRAIWLHAWFALTCPCHTLELPVAIIFCTLRGGALKGSGLGMKHQAGGKLKMARKGVATLCRSMP